MTGPEIIKELRERQSFTQANLATRVGVGTPHISKIEAGKDRPSVELCHAIALVLGANGERLAAMFGHLPNWADHLLREHPMLTLLTLKQCAASIGFEPPFHAHQVTVLPSLGEVEHG